MITENEFGQHELKPIRKRVTREELQDIARPEFEQQEYLPEIKFEKWGDQEIALVARFRAENLGIDIDDRGSLKAKKLREHLTGLVSTLQAHTSAVDKSRLELLEQQRDKVVQGYFQRVLLEEMPEITQQANTYLATHYPEILPMSPDATARDIVQFLYHIPRDMLADIVIGIGELYKTQEPIEREKIQTAIRNFVDKVKAARPSLIPESARERVASVAIANRITFVSKLEAYTNRLFRKSTETDYAGSYSREYSIMLLHIQNTARTLVKTLTHEYIHALSSHRPAYIMTEDPKMVGPIGFSEFVPKIETTNEGTMSRRNSYIQHRRWLNEAVTENITGELIDMSPEDRTYPKERQLFELLLTKGFGDNVPRYTTLGVESSLIEESVVTEAFFEDRDPSLPESQQRTKQKKFIRQISELYSPGFINRLDSVERYLGVDTAIAIMQHSDFDPKNDSIPHLRSQQQAELYRDALKQKTIIT